jgi:signal transduction histidine kinase
VVAAIFGLSFLFGIGSLIVHLVSVRSRDLLVYMGLCVTALIIVNETMVAMSVYAGVYLIAFSKAFETVRIHRGIRKRARERVEQRLRQAEKMEAIGRVSGGIAHDFNNVLGVISGCLSLIELDLGLRGPLADHLRSGREALKTGKRMVHQLLDLAREEATPREHIEVSDFLSSNAKLLLRMVSPDKNFELRVEPEVGGVTMSRGELAQVLMNLVVNADHAMPTGGTVEVLAGRTVEQLGRSRRAPSVPSIRITVSDDGCGISPEVLGRVFEPFFTTKGERGTGMGLATTYSIVHQAGGRLEVESEPGRGTRFHVFLPRSERRASA